MFKNKNLLITGGTGSFGKAVLSRFLKTDFSQLIIFSRDEKKQEDLRLSINDKRIKFYIGDVRDYNSINEACIGVDYIFHAAALKQVPSCEFYPLEAVKTNVLGSENVMNAAVNQNVSRIIMLSTDKAVYPANAMGMTKALMEKNMIAKSRLLQNSKTSFIATRYGNVIASRGSVIPLFIEQILHKKPITLTDPNMTRFLMSLPESVDLVLEAFKSGINGDIFIQKSPSASVGNIADALKIIFNSKSSNKIIGTRHGEKLFEVLASREEMARSHDLGNYIRVPLDNRDLNYDNYFTQGEKKISVENDYSSEITNQLDVPSLVELLMKEKLIKEKICA
ncbi:polysaccharide biosynthesis protein [Alphaproteobacteria bacterium]|nr:polysaccharide biosynthesis protein [Alphaproteobacteria bacterium]MDC1023102.1 polysaccharide biosynthesis protein [Alphaproteobacteria bacterium]